MTRDLEERVAELLDANNRYVEANRALKRRIADLENVNEALVYALAALPRTTLGLARGVDIVHGRGVVTFDLGDPNGVLELAKRTRRDIDVVSGSASAPR